MKRSYTGQFLKPVLERRETKRKKGVRRRSDFFILSPCGEGGAA